MKSNNGPFYVQMNDISNLGEKNGDLFSLIKTAEKIQSSLTSGHVIDEVTLMTLIYNLLMYSYLPTHEILFLCVSL